MKGRDLLILAAVLLVAGFAAADALRSKGGSAPSTAAARAPTTTRAGPIRIQALQDLRARAFTGRIVFTDQGCTVREVDLASGTFFPLPPLRGGCVLASPPRTELIAFSLPANRRDVMPYRVVNLNIAARDLASFRARNGSVVWSPDGTRVAWCEPSGRGQEYEIGEEPRSLPGCPLAYTTDGRPAYLRERNLVVAGRTILHVDGRVTGLSFGTDGSLALVEDGTRVLLYGTEAGRPFTLARKQRLPSGLRGLAPLFSPTNCSVAFRSAATGLSSTIEILDLGRCPPARRVRTFPGHAAAWSPDGRWLAVAGRTSITFHPIQGDGPTVRFEASAAALTWKG